MRALLLRAWLRPLLVGLSLWLGIFGGSWATMHWLSGSIQSNIETAGPSNSASSRHARRWPGSRRNLGDYAPGDRGRALRGAADGLAGPSALDRARSACREAVERVRDLYDRVGTAVDGGLEEVVRAVREEQRRHSEQVETLQRQVGAARRADDALGRVLQDARREVARPLDLTRRHGRERDYGPSRSGRHQPCTP